MNKIESYRQILRQMDAWDSYLLAESGLPGPRGNLELVHAVADEGEEALFHRYISYGPDKTPAGSALEFLPVCGAFGLGRLIAEGQYGHLPLLRELASDPRWRIREGVAMALQRVGAADMDRLLVEMEDWCRGNRLEQRAAAAALAEPVLLKDAPAARRVLDLLDRITASIESAPDRQDEEFQTLRKGLGYCWSVAVCALPEPGKTMMEKWFLSADRDVRWVMRENLKKNRLTRLDPEWVARWSARLAEKAG